MAIPPLVKSVARTSLVTFAGAFFGALVILKVPTSWAELRADVAPALAAAIIAEVAYLRTVFKTSAQLDAVRREAAKFGSSALLVFLGLGYTIPAHTESTTAYRGHVRPMPARVAVAWRSVVRTLTVAAMLLGLVRLGPIACGAATVATVTPAVATTAACIITTAAADESQGMAAIAIVEDVVAKCGADALTIATVLDAETKGEIVGTGGDAGALPAYRAQMQSVAAAAHAMVPIDAGSGK